MWAVAGSAAINSLLWPSFSLLRGRAILWAKTRALQSQCRERVGAVSPLLARPRPLSTPQLALNPVSLRLIQPAWTKILRVCAELFALFGLGATPGHQLSLTIQQWVKLTPRFRQNSISNVSPFCHSPAPPVPAFPTLLLVQNSRRRLI